jgi:L-aminopeptidase/D-esterase-like protein
MRGRARDLGIRIGRMEPGPHDAITDVACVLVDIMRAHGRLSR